MSGIKPVNALSYNFDFLRVPFKEAANVVLTLPKDTGTSTGWNDGDTVNAASSSGILTVTGDTGTAVGTAIGVATDDDTTGVVYLNGNDLITTYEYQIGGVNTKGALHIAGTAGTIWSANLGYCTPQGDNIILIADSAFDGLFNITDLDSLAVMFRCKQGATQNADVQLFQWGAVQKAIPGGCDIEVRSGGSFDMEAWPSSASGTGTVANKSWGTLNTENWIGGLLDFTGGTVKVAKDGDYTQAGEGTNDDLALADIKGDYPWSDTTSTYGFSLLGTHNPSVAATKWVNNTSGSLHVSDFIIMRNGVTASTFIGVFADYSDGEYNEMRLQRIAD